MTPEALLTVLAGSDEIPKDRSLKERAWTYVSGCTIQEIFEAGTTVNYLNHSHPQNKVALALIVKSKLEHVLKYIDAKKTVRSDYDKGVTVSAIVKYCKGWYVEEIVKVLHTIAEGKYGKMYERFQAPEIIDIFRIYEAEERADFLAEWHTRIVPEEEETQTIDFTELEGYEGKTLSQVWKEEQEKLRSEKLQKLIDKTNKLLRGRSFTKLEQIDEVADIYAEAERIFEKLERKEILTFEEERFCNRHNIPVVGTMHTEAHRIKARDTGMDKETLTYEMEDRIRQKVQEKKLLTPTEEDYANRKRIPLE